MTIRQMHHVGAVVEDLERARDFFVALGLEVEGAARVDGDWAGEVIGLAGVRSEIVMLRTPDGRNRIELSRIDAPRGPAPEAHAANVPGLRHLAFAVDDLDAALAAVRAEGFDVVGSVQDFEGVYRLCYVRGPEGLLVELAEELTGA
jgi:catechol 2,3-dioxygenase-like lactoylglutathione lyase family enzyme